MQRDYAAIGNSLDWFYYWQPEVTRRLDVATGDLWRCYNLGISGVASDYGAAHVLEAVRLRPHIATVSYAMNDVAFLTRAQTRDNITSIVSALLAVLPPARIVLWTSTPIINDGVTQFVGEATPRANVNAYNDVYRERSAALGVTLADVWEAWSNPPSSSLMQNAIHENEAGARTVTAPVIADAILSVI